VRPTGLFNAAVLSLLLWLALMAVVALLAYVLYAVL
jgi:hypothetical protein